MARAPASSLPAPGSVQEQPARACPFELQTRLVPRCRACHTPPCHHIKTQRYLSSDWPTCTVSLTPAYSSVTEPPTSARTSTATLSVSMVTTTCNAHANDRFRWHTCLIGSHIVADLFFPACDRAFRYAVSHCRDLPHSWLSAKLEVSHLHHVFGEAPRRPK